MKLVIQTQYKENYAYHNEDYVHGVSEPYWKFKGGSTYVVPNILATDINECQDILEKVRPLITYSNAGSEAYILDEEIVENNAKVCEDWETPTEMFINEKNGDVVALKVIDNREDGYMRDEILEKTESWTMTPENGRKGYSATYLMCDGDECDGEAELKEWFNSQEVA